MSLIDFLVTGPGITVSTFMNEFADFHNAVLSGYKPTSFEAYVRFRDSMRSHISILFKTNSVQK